MISPTLAGIESPSEWCIAIRVQRAVEAGASRDDVIEAGFMAVLMHGRPALMYMTPLLEAVDEFIINPATIYVVFRASGRCWIKAQCAGNGHSIGKRCNAGPVPA